MFIIVLKIMHVKSKTTQYRYNTCFKWVETKEDFNSCYLMFQLPYEDGSYKLFSCNQRSKLLTNGETALAEVVMNSTAVGILINLPGFESRQSEIESVKQVLQRPCTSCAKQNHDYLWMTS